MTCTDEQLDVVRAAFPWHDDLHGMWSESPKLKMPFNSNSMASGTQLAAEFTMAVTTPPPSADALPQGPLRPPNPTEDTEATQAHKALTNVDSDDDMVDPCEIFKKTKAREAAVIDLGGDDESGPDEPTAEVCMGPSLVGCGTNKACCNRDISLMNDNHQMQYIIIQSML